MDDVHDADGVERLEGEVGALVFANPASGFGVVELTTRDGACPRASGPLAALTPGQPVGLVGRWVEHPRYGPTFEAAYYEQAPPASTAGLRAFLSSPVFPGVGDVIAGRLVDAFGLELGTVIQQQPDRLLQVRGVSQALAARLTAAWAQAGILGTLVARLAEVGLGPAVARGVLRRFGDDALTQLRTDPYELLTVAGVRWRHVDALGARIGVQPTDPRRLRAGARAGHAATSTAAGHVYLTQQQVTGAARRLLGTDELTAAHAVTLAAQAGDLLGDRAALGELPSPRWYRPPTHAAEVGLAADCVRLVRARSRIPAAAGAAAVEDRDLTGGQAQAVQHALSAPVSVLTGGPGTGKTRTVVALVRACAAHDLRVALAAPTGRAARRLEEVTGARASTVHRLLEAHPDPDGGFAFGYDGQRRLPHDLVVVDEWSMADVHLAGALFAAVDDGAHLLLVGDVDQLPPVGPGAVLRDLLDTGHVPATRLETVHRQARASRIVTLAHEVNAGRVRVPRGRDGDVFAVAERPGAVAARVAGIVAASAPVYFGCPPSDVQVLAPMYRGPAGVDALNEAIKDQVNPGGGRRAVAGFHEGDRVVATRNDPELDIANGDIGEVASVAVADATLTVAFPQGLVAFPADRVAELSPAWCLTVHKSQGGEWPVVVLVLDRAHRAMLWRELVYTAVSRAVRGLLLVGDVALLGAAARRTGSGLRARQSGLAARLARDWPT